MAKDSGQLARETIQPCEPKRGRDAPLSENAEARLHVASDVSLATTYLTPSSSDAQSTLALHADRWYIEAIGNAFRKI